jgi:hypothetical protein
MASDSLARLGASVIAEAFNSYDRFSSKSRIVTVDCILNMQPVVYSDGKHDENVVYAINDGAATILVRAKKDESQVSRRVIKWYDPTTDTPTLLLKLIAEEMDDKDVTEFWIYPDRIESEIKSGLNFSQSFEAIPNVLLERLYEILKKLLKDVNIDEYDSEKPCIHINKEV